MATAHVRSLDLNLIPVFEAVYEERNMTRAAVRLAMTQSAVSHAMERLRHATRIELFVRQARGVEPTTAGQRLYERIRGTMGLIQAALDEARGFDPMTARRTFDVAVALPSDARFVGALFAELEHGAPGVRVRFHRASATADLRALLRKGACELLLGPPRYDTRDLRSEWLWDDRPVLVARKDHPRIRQRPTRELLQKERFIRLRDPDDTEPLHDVLRVLGERTTVVAEGRVPPDLLIMVQASDLLAVCSENLVLALGERLGVRALPLPGKVAPVPLHMSWHMRADADPGHRWFRGLFARLAADARGRRGAARPAHPGS